MEGKANLLQQLSLLHKEYDCEKETFRRETETMGIARKVKRGLCWFPLSVGRSYYNSLDQYVTEVFRSADIDIEHNFEYGRTVCFFEEDATGGLHYFNFTATVSFVDKDSRMVVSLTPDRAEQLQQAERLGVQLYFDETTYRLMFEAMDAVINAKGNRLAELRDIFHGSQPIRRSEPYPTRLPWLNTSQEHAVNEVLRAQDVAVVHGPPGTGKTTTLVEAVYETLRREPQVLVCAQSNMAVDWISEKLVDRGVPVLRIGNPTRVNDKMLSFCYERQFEAHPQYEQLWAIRRTIRQLYAQRKSGNTGNFHQKIARLKDRAAELELSIRSSLFASARVIACTLAGSAHPLLTGQRFHTLFIDEAAQALEAACWIALRKAHRVVLAGDHCQLMPTIKSPEALHGGLGFTLMEHLAQTRPECVTLLTTQYRMCETLMHFSSEWFYEGKVKAAPEVHNRSILDFDTPIVWIDSAQAELADGEPSHEEMIGGSFGRINRAEAELTIESLKNYIRRIGVQRFKEERLDIGIISPYRVQVQHLRRLVKADAELKPFRNVITINTVDGFQGQERDIILVSLVRANQQGQIGFLSDLRRMNVAMTRARMKLFILGDCETLTKHKFYKELFKYCQQVNN